MNSNWPQVLPRKGNLRFEKINGKSHWFEIYKLNNLTYAFLEPNHWEEVISYLIIGEMRAVLFDSGMGIADIHAEVASITNLPIVVINSHSHYDHIGGNHQFNDIWSFRNEFENNRIERGYSNSECKKYMTEGSYINLPANVDIPTFSIPGVRITKYLHHKETIDLGNRTLTVHSTPGETPGAISLSDDLYNIFFAGDLLYPGPLWLHLNESNWREFSHSIDDLRAMYDDIQHICPAHNEICISRDFVDKVKQGIESINNNTIKGIMTDESLMFSFESFSILAKCMTK
jgi:glyoxylase-like metal-dependent hydrolase (beta-lactamase superfamily II)